MAPGKYSRIDGRRSSNYCSTVAVVTFVAFSLFAVWMFMTSSIVPTKYTGSSFQENSNGVREKVTEYDLRQDDSNQDMDGRTVENKLGNSGDENKDEMVVKDVSREQEESSNIGETDQEEKMQEGHNDVTIALEKKEESNVDSESDNDSSSKDDIEKENSDNNTEVNVENTDEIETEEKEKTSVNIKLDENKPSVAQEGSETGDSVDNEKLEEKSDDNFEQTGREDNLQIKEKVQAPIEVLPTAELSELLNETSTQNGAWSTQAVESQKEKNSQENSISKDEIHYSWKVCNTTAGPDYIPCLDNWKVIRTIGDTSHYQHRERHCPAEAPSCLVPLPAGYKRSVQWPKSRDKIWFSNVPHTKLAEVKGHQNWVKVSGEYLTFPGGGTQFIHGATRYIEQLQEGRQDIAWGKRSRVVLDVGCGVASFGGYLFDKDVLTMSFAPKDEHEAQVQFALERGIPALLAVMGTKRLPFPGGVFDIVHCARCRVPWHVEGGKLLLELNRVLRPGGYFIWSATPVYRKNSEDSGIWKEMSKLTKAMCWDLVVIEKDKVNGVAAAIYRKPTSNDCYQKRQVVEPPLCKESDDQNAAWKVELQACMHKIPIDSSERGSRWPEEWPVRLEKPPYWLNNKAGVYGKAAPEDFTADYQHWKNVVSQSYLKGIGINWSSVRNAMDMRAVYGGFAAALKDLKLWVMNVVPIDSPDTLPIIYERGLFGMYHDWCESFNTYPRAYDLLHADHLFSILRKRCKLVGVMAEVDRILRPEGKLIVRDDVETINEIENMAKSLQWDIKMVYSQDKEGLLCVQKTDWRPKEAEAITSAII